MQTILQGITATSPRPYRGFVLDPLLWIRLRMPSSFCGWSVTSYMLQSPWRIEQIFVLFFFPLWIGGNSEVFRTSKRILRQTCWTSWDTKLFTSPNVSTAQTFLAVYVVETILRWPVVVWGIIHGIVWHADVLQQCKLWQKSKLWNLSISIKATVATVGHKASHTNMCFTYKHVHLVFLH